MTPPSRTSCANLGSLRFALLAAGPLHPPAYGNGHFSVLHLAVHLLPWLFVAPGVLMAVRRFPLDREHWKTSVPVHLGLCALCTTAIALLVHLMWLILPPQPFTSSGLPFGFDPGSINWLEAAFFRARFHLPVYCIVVLAAQAWRFHREAREKKQRATELETLLAQARIHHLHAQLQPHFLFNALHAISSLVYTAPARADEMIATLSELLRRTLRDGGRAEVPLRDELDVLALYLDLQHIRFGDRFEVEKNIAADTLDAAVPSLLIQPLVENTVRHGLEKRDRVLHLSITTRRIGQRLHLEILDDGPGLPQDAPVREGVGLGNTRARLALLHGTEHALELCNRPGGGAVLTCEFPFHLASKIPPTADLPWPCAP